MIVENLSVPFDRRVWREACALREAGAAVSVICPRGKSYDTETKAEINAISIYRYSLPLEGVASGSRFSVGSFLLEYFLALTKTFCLSLRIYFRNRFHVIHVANPPDIFFLIGWCYKPFGVKFVFDHHDVCPEGYLDKKKEPKPDFLYHVQVLLEKLSFRTADIVISTNESYKGIAVRRGGKNSESVFVVRNGPDENSWPKMVTQVNGKMGFNYLVGYIGVMAKLDGVDFVVRAADYVVNVARRKEVGFVLIGSGTSYGELRELADSLSLTDNVCFTGRIPDDRVFEILPSIDVGVSPDPPGLLNNISTMNKVMDYMWFGKPIVSFDLAESRYSAQDSAIYVNQVSPVAVGKAILALLDDPEQRERMAAFGKHRVRSLTWQSSRKNLISAYKYLWGI
jgi:glycosyltransferase involved in cell wall biosynthesis